MSQYCMITDILSGVIGKCIHLERLFESVKKPHYLSEALNEKFNLYRKSKNDP